MKSIFMEIASQANFTILEMEVDKDHIHLLVKSSPKISTLQIVRRLKQISTHRIWQRHSAELRKPFWKEHTFWRDGYFVCSIGNVSRETVEK
jgi:putative transposase